MPQQKYTVVSLFSGAMGLDIGLERSGRFRLLACVEKDAPTRETIAANRDAGRIGSPDTRIYGDINALTPEQLMADLGVKPGEIDVVVGGPPCQSFSTAGKRRTVQDPRGTLLWRYLAFIAALKPRFFLMENVRGLVSAALRHRPIAERPKKGGPPLAEDEEPGSVMRAFAADLSALPDTRYRVDGFEVNSVNYGAPQIRERVLFIGNRLGQQVEFPRPTHAAPWAESSKGGPQGDLFGPKRSLPWSTLGEALAGLEDPEPVVLDFSPRKKRFLSMVPPGSNWRSLPEDVQRESMGGAWHAKGGRSGWWRRLTFDLPCPTLITMPNHASTSLCHPTETRALSLKEYARIQEFPDDWHFHGTVSQRYRQVGNAVPVRLGAIAGETIVAALDGAGAAPATDAEDFRLVYVQSHVRTRKWYSAGKTHVWKDGKQGDNPTYSDPVTQEKVRLP